MFGQRSPRPRPLLATALLLLAVACGGAARPDATPPARPSSAPADEPKAAPIPERVEPGLALFEDLATGIRVPGLAHRPKRVVDAAKWLDIDATVEQFDGLDALTAWQLAEVRGTADVLRRNAEGLARSDVIPSNASTQSLRTRPMVVFADDQFVSLAFTQTTQRLWELGPVRSTRCVSARRRDDAIIDNGVIFGGDLGRRLEALELEIGHGTTPCLTRSGLWLCDASLEVPFEEGDATVYAGAIVPYELLGGEREVREILDRAGDQP